MRLSLLAAVPLAAAAATGGFELCNGHAELCSRPYDNITFVGAHNSPFVGYFPSHNQNIAVAEQLALGVRFLQAQTRDKDGSPQLCHSHCLLEDAGPLGGLLETVKTFLDANPAEVVTLLLTNHGGFPGTAFGDVFREVGLESYAFVPAEGGSALGQWPTLGDMIVSGKRLVVFMGSLPALNSVTARGASAPHKFWSNLFSSSCRLPTKPLCALHFRRVWVIYGVSPKLLLKWKFSCRTLKTAN